jgi:transcriptional regulator with XRE-family HTH domain
MDGSETTLSFGELIQRARKDRGWTQEQLADRLGIPLDSVRNWEQDHRRPRVDAVGKIVEMLDIPFGDLLAAFQVPVGEKAARKLSLNHELLKHWHKADREERELFRSYLEQRAESRSFRKLVKAWDEASETEREAFLRYIEGASDAT